MDACKKIIEDLLDKKHCHYAWPFYKPLNAEKLGLTDYHHKIKKPMDLGSIKYKLEDGHYSSVLEFAEDVRLVFSNCFKYFDPDNDYVGMAQELRHVFEMLYAQIPDEPVPNVPAHNTHIQGNMQGPTGKPLAWLKLTLSSNSEFDSDTDTDSDSDSEDLAAKLKARPQCPPPAALSPKQREDEDDPEASITDGTGRETEKEATEATS
ncbi:bromodomain-containing protein 3-like [Drosophila guanche]|uniref:Blast:Homeotic protein female sterile n=1 Tax=Drosophila guanche TaxID=7266 RepID=A0A3B0K6K1_DROGU|nr:bromodomain-containing protein 3-like [Drosophila guanche]XP_034140907.1 bromodomain-containing protein 3-like [Drosophila guanche]SPP88913.1 blast:Homeotic protein female sterile [Drosophila guanche]SPP90187.1 blast:Homeotic protein female sterile [Drosophila guanche]